MGTRSIKTRSIKTRSIKTRSIKSKSDSRMPHDAAKADHLAPSHFDGLTIAQFSARLRCAECGGQLHSVKPWRLEDLLGKPLGRRA
jgi:ribosomal protein L34E